MHAKPETKAVRSNRIVLGNEPLALPIYQTSTFVFESVEQLERYLQGDDAQYLYSRYENPTLRALQEKIAGLEKGDQCYVFSSGMAAITSSILAFVKAGDEILAADSLYGRTQLFMEQWLPRFGIKSRLIPVAEFPEIDRYMTPQTRIVYMETPTNPTLRVIDIAATADVAHRHGALLMIDSTFASPVNQNPMEMGADAVLHSLTKYIAGHSDVVAGASIVNKANGTAIRDAIRTFGGCMDPLAAYLVERGIKTLHLRVDRQNQTAQFIAERLEKHPKVARVNYPGLKSHGQHEIAARQMRGFGGMLSFEVAGYEEARKFVEKLKIINHAASLGGVESLVSLPILTSHYGQPAHNLQAAGISAGTIRLSVGIENPEDLWQDLEQALLL